ncbi:helix-turn-helix domain-containing protein [Siphonobacter sp. SORGH_AS_1065]|uniref:helix-turn-helix domain-containing protein n=1 Tax=Siphonobacter sp. SORGH_AS_1065 TaxID=3041795 RepID=UPI00277E895B|nr:helix-turn-helix domain-containing protein [Siphonobacter sp. SORGH_AS_1065]MDQ1088604.1 putative DNA-binding transcriptional regulator AlpA [Siphonobacter sp. SORGH_AS_1065]
MENPFDIINARFDNLERMLGLLLFNQPVAPPKASEPELTVGVPEALVILGISRETLYKRIASIPHIKKHNRLRFYKSKLIEYMNGPVEESEPSILKYKRRKR